LNESERQTRRIRIDTRLRALGWTNESNPVMGAGKSRLREARALGGPGRARAEMAEVASRASGMPARREAASRARGAQVSEPVEAERPVELAPALKEIMEATHMTVGRAKALVPDAAERYRRANDAMQGNVEAINALAKEAQRDFPAPDDPATAYVFAVARMYDARLGTDKRLIEKERRNVARLDDILFNTPPVAKMKIEQPEAPAKPKKAAIEIPRAKSPQDKPKKAAVNIPKPKAPPMRKAA